MRGVGPCDQIETCWVGVALQAKQAQEAAAKQEKSADSGPTLEADDAEDLDPNLYYERRVRGVASARAAGSSLSHLRSAFLTLVFDFPPPLLAYLVTVGKSVVQS